MKWWLLVFLFSVAWPTYIIACTNTLDQKGNQGNQEHHDCNGRVTRSDLSWRIYEQWHLTSILVNRVSTQPFKKFRYFMEGPAPSMTHWIHADGYSQSAFKPKKESSDDMLRKPCLMQEGNNMANAAPDLTIRTSSNHGVSSYSKRTTNCIISQSRSFFSVLRNRSSNVHRWNRIGKRW